MDRARLCARPGCGAVAAASLTYEYAGRTVWLDELAPEREPSAYDLCAAHADNLRVPQGWTRDDRRGTLRFLPQRVAV